MSYVDIFNEVLSIVIDFSLCYLVKFLKSLFWMHLLMKIIVNRYMALRGFADVLKFFQDEGEDKVE